MLIQITKNIIVFIKKIFRQQKNKSYKKNLIIKQYLKNGNSYFKKIKSSYNPYLLKNDKYSFSRYMNATRTYSKFNRHK